MVKEGVTSQSSVPCCSYPLKFTYIARLVALASGATMLVHVIDASGLITCHDGGRELNGSMIGNVMVEGTVTWTEAELFPGVPSVFPLVSKI